MSQIMLGGLTVLNTATHLDANFSELYGFAKNLISDDSGRVQVGPGALAGLDHQMTVFYAGGISRYGIKMKPAADNCPAISFYNAAFAGVGSIATTSSTTTFNTSSDRRLKCNIVAAGAAGSIIDAVQIVAHDWLAGGARVAFGVIAQDLHAAYPAAVTAGDADATVTQAWAVDYSKLVPLLVKEVQALRARVAALEA